MNEALLFATEFPHFARFLGSADAVPVDEIRPPASADELDAEEQLLGVPLPASYKTFLMIVRGVSIQGGGFQMGSEHPFFHHFPSWEQLSPRERSAVKSWPPPSEGMLCFADFWLKGDGDQALLDVSKGLQDGEYPVFYYDHEEPSVRKLADSFREFIERIVAGG